MDVSAASPLGCCNTQEDTEVDSSEVKLKKIFFANFTSVYLSKVI